MPVVGPLAAAEAFAGRAKVALVALPGIGREHLSQLVQGLSFANIIIVPDLFGIQSLWITSRDLGGVLGLEVKKNLLVPGNRLLKRLLDYGIAHPGSSPRCPCWQWPPSGLRSSVQARCYSARSAKGLMASEL